jgi:RNA polymerase sigma factor (sigma-70 family)
VAKIMRWVAVDDCCLCSACRRVRFRRTTQQFGQDATWEQTRDVQMHWTTIEGAFLDDRSIHGGDRRAMTAPPGAPDHVPSSSLGRSRSRDRMDPSVVAQLVKRAAEGEQDAWNALVDRFASTLWVIARGYRLTAADAADVFQTTWLRLLEHLDRIEQPERVGAWLATTARRECLRVHRMAGRQVPSGDDFDLVADPATLGAPDCGLLAAERKRLVGEMIEQLPERSRLLLRLLSADSPPSYAEIGRVLSMPIGSIGPTRARALEQLRRVAVRAGVDLGDVGVA